MGRNKKQIFLLIITLYLCCSGCAISIAPEGWLPTAEQTQTQAYGGWIVLNRSTDYWQKSKMLLQGELIAISEDTVFVLTDTLNSIPKVVITNAQLATYDSHFNGLRLWTVAGIVSTLSHGVILGISAPIWMFSGNKIVRNQSLEPILDFPDDPLSSFEPYARFPQGLHKNINRKQLEVKKKL
jgi:hypothetical protein